MAKRNLQKREVRIIAVAAVLVVCLLGYRIAQGPLKKYKGSIDEVRAAENALQQARMFKDSALEARRGKGELKQRASARGPGWDLYQYLTGAVKQASLENRTDIQSKPSPSKEAQYSVVQVTIKGASLKELTDLLFAIHSGDKLVILDSINNLRPDRESKGLECVMTFLTPTVGAA